MEFEHGYLGSTIYVNVIHGALQPESPPQSYFVKRTHTTPDLRRPKFKVIISFHPQYRAERLKGFRCDRVLAISSAVPIPVLDELKIPDEGVAYCI